jgi:hypothetical protein
MKRDCIQDFVENWQLWDTKTKSHFGNQPVWNNRFRDAKYYSIVPSVLNTSQHFIEMHYWCEHYFGREHYANTGYTFWFESERDAAWFALRWA